MRLYVHETIPYIWLSDGHNYIEAQFTKESISEYKSAYSHVRFSSLRDKILYVSRWSLEIKYANSNECFTSYQNVTLMLVIESFRPILNIRPNQR